MFKSIWLMFACCSRHVVNEDLRRRRRHCGLGEVEQADAERDSTNYQLLRYRSLSRWVLTPARSVRDLGIYIDADLSMRAHVNRTVSRCFAALRQLRQIRRAVPTATFQILVVALVHSLLDYSRPNAILVGIPTYLVRRLQSVLNAAARLIYHLRPHDHITDALATLRWLRVPERVQYKIALLTYKVLHDSAPRYLGMGLFVAVADLPGRR